MVCSYIFLFVIPRVGKEEERKTKDEVDENEVPSPDSLSTTFPLGGFVVFFSCEPMNNRQVSLRYMPYAETSFSLFTVVSRVALSSARICL